MDRIAGQSIEKRWDHTTEPCDAASYQDKLTGLDHEWGDDAGSANCAVPGFVGRLLRANSVDVGVRVQFSSRRCQ
ncbi:hypothetical protein CO2235_U1010014 [Cupriavidus oxalaticus]|uniref:Uncharacterized protein n=1 Tax=Cupriavidus oxalaticus TaxID=96344 RepID=A0A375FMQ9_9BURK|nr:hypothetical protein CO2235_U1010014 [Cupriavidus oxalaticus]